MSEQDKEEQALRPNSWEGYIGQEAIKRNLQDDIVAVFVRGDMDDPLKHMLFEGPPGLGKTTLSRLLSNELETNLIETSGPALSEPESLIRILRSVNAWDILFIDEIHRMPLRLEEVLYSVMEDGEAFWSTGNGRNAQTIRIKLPPFTLVGATTRPDLISQPMRDRFGEIYHMHYYTDNEMEDIVERSTRVLGVPIDAEGIIEIAKRARSTPRIANRLVKNVRDYALVHNDGVVDKKAVVKAMERRGIDTLGLDEDDRAILRFLAERDAPVGLETMGAAVNVEHRAVEQMHEPFLLRKELMARTPRGRVITPKGRAHIGKA